MRRTSLSIGLLALLAACREAPTGPVRHAPTTPRLAVAAADNGALVERTRYEQSFSGVIQLCGSTEPVDLEETVITRVQTVSLASGTTGFTLHSEFVIVEGDCV